MNLIKRPRRLRTSFGLRKMVKETRLAVEDLMYPLFVVEGQGIKKEIPSMPGIYHFSLDQLVKEVAAVQELGIPGILLFGLPQSKDELGSGAYDPQGIVQRALRALKKEYPQLILSADVCLCAYTSHGHCGVVQDGQIVNDSSVELLSKVAVSYAQAGADILAPSDMMDGRIGAIRQSLDAAGFIDRAIMAYSAKYASSFYGPFREAADSTPAFGDRRTYQMDYANGVEALREVALDLEEGADIVMVKPALLYLDVIKEVRNSFDVPIAAYNVSGEYSMIKAAAGRGWLDEKGAALEGATAIKRAGANIIITYFAKQLAKWIKEG